MKKSLPHFSSAFTLVELIVVIAVLAVLAAISFSTVANITSGARDSARLTDISSMKTSLESYNATKGGFPIPDNAVSISWSGNLAWSQGTFGDNTSRALNTISRPKDPKWNVDYSYSVSNSKKEYEIATVLEKATSYLPTDKAYAQGEQYDTIIKGNFNGVALRVSSAISAWILSVPTLIASDIKDAKLENIVFAYPKSGNEPFSYTGVVASPQAIPAGWTVKQVWSGALVLPKSDSELQQLTTDLKAVYTGSPAANNETIKSLLAATDNKVYGSNVVNIIGGNVVLNTPAPTNPIINYNTSSPELLLNTYTSGIATKDIPTNTITLTSSKYPSASSDWFGALARMPIVITPKFQSVKIKYTITATGLSDGWLEWFGLSKAIFPGSSTYMIGDPSSTNTICYSGYPYGNNANGMQNRTVATELPLINTPAANTAVEFNVDKNGVYTTKLNGTTVHSNTLSTGVKNDLLGQGTMYFFIRAGGYYDSTPKIIMKDLDISVVNN